jgi:V-type H+-transporting ATPase subunit F
MSKKTFSTKTTLLTSIIADETTVTGFLLTGMGERNRKGQTNFYVVNKDSSDGDIDKFLRELLARPDIGIVLVGQEVAERVRNVILEHEEIIPTILEIPSKNNPYDPEKDPIVLRAAQILWGCDTGLEKLRELAAQNAK